ncbi:CdaR family transcriptional regulator [Leucobacter sp. wl10]|uniref:PucR family transcriptional regulator n=1 Tax=Leucobacter sp. wl10 TaxID=2304677 RepID=UPI0013C36F76|nr:helix-turn-helix domain-containing protein [Leucobacter sp. wl10]
MNPQGKQGSEVLSDPLLLPVIQHLADNAEAIGERLLEAYTDEIVDYRSLPEGYLSRDVADMARRNLLTLLSWLSGEVDEARSLEEFRNSAVRRFRQGVSVQALLHAYRVWGQVVWNEIARLPVCQTSPATGFTVAGEVMRYVNRVSLAVANSYLEEAEDVIQDRQLAERDALEELLSSSLISERVASYLTRLGTHLRQEHRVLLLRRRHSTASEPHDTRDGLAAVRRFLARDPRYRPLIGLREDEIVVVLPMPEERKLSIREVADDLARSLDAFVVGVSRAHEGEAQVATAYREAADASRVAYARGDRRAYFYTDVLLQSVIDRSGLGDVVHAETVAPLIAYDRKHGSKLSDTLRAYILHRLNLTRTAEELSVQPNTVRYRLDRIRELSGRDPNHPDDLILLALGVRIDPGSSHEGPGGS